MKPLSTIFLLSLLLHPHARAADRPAAEQRAIDGLKKLGARIEYDDKAAGKPVVRVVLFGSLAGDKDVAPLRDLPTLRSLDLVATEVTDAGLVILKDLKELRSVR